MPPGLVYFAYIRFMAFATTHGAGTSMTPDSMTFTQAVRIWETYHKKYGEHMCLHTIDGTCEICGHVNTTVRRSFESAHQLINP